MLYESQYYGVCDLGSSLYHHGIHGQKWGRRRFQNSDGTLTAAGKARYGTGTSLDTDGGERISARKTTKALNKADQDLVKSKYGAIKQQKRIDNDYKRISKIEDRAAEKNRDVNSREQKKIDKLNERISENKQRKSNYEASSKQIQAHVKQQIEKAIKSGYNVNAKEVYRSANEGRHTAMQTAFGLAGGVASRLASRGDTMKGSKYKLSKSQNGNASYTYTKDKHAKLKYAGSSYLKTAVYANAATVAIQSIGTAVYLGEYMKYARAARML